MVQDMPKNEKEYKTPHASIATQYIKDLSFERTDSEEKLDLNDGPEVKISLNIDAQPKDKTGTHEVVITVKTQAVAVEKTIFILELVYAGVFIVKNIPEDEKRRILMVYFPGILFPYIRRIISDITRDAGFTPLMIDPIDFASLFQKKLDQEKNQNKENKKEQDKEE